MNNVSTQVVIPFRHRESGDPRRGANLDVVMAWWYAHGFNPIVVSDGLDGDEQFNRHRAYNRAIEEFPETEVFVFSEADMLIHPDQINRAIYTAWKTPGLVVPFNQYRYLSDSVTEFIRETYADMDTELLADWWKLPAKDPHSIFDMRAESTMDNGTSIGAVNVVSRETLEITGGFTEATSGNWYDDRIIEEGFRFLTGGKTAFVQGPAVHLYHLPGHSGDHLSAEDKAATERNKQLLNVMRRNIRIRDKKAVRRLMTVRQKESVK